MQILTSSVPTTEEKNLFFRHTEGSWVKVNYQCLQERKTHGSYSQKDESELFIIISGRVQVSVKNTLTKKSYSFIAAFGDKFIVEPNETYNLYTLTKCEWLNLVSSTEEKHQPHLDQVYDLMGLAA